MEIKSIVILRGKYGPDKLMFETDIQSAQWPFTGTQPIYTDVASGHGEAFCEKNFAGIPVKLKNI